MEIFSLQTKIHIEERLRRGLNISDTANVDGAWEEFSPLGTVINYDVCGFYFFPTRATITADFWVDIGISTDGINITEILSDLRIQTKDNFYSYHKIYVPLEIPRGYKLYGRAKANTGNSADFIVCYVFPVYKPFSTISCSVYKRYDIRVDADGYSPIYEVVNPVPFNIKYIIISSSVIKADPTPSSQGVPYNLYLGQSGSEQIIFNSYNYIHSVGDIHPHIFSFPIYIPKGERLAISHDPSLSTETTFDYSIYLFG